jgi:hypothetical protein
MAGALNSYWVLAGLTNRSFRKRFRRVIGGMRAARLSAFDGLKSVHTAGARVQDLRRRLHAYETRLCEVDLTAGVFVAAMLGVSLTTLVVSTLASPFLVAHWAHPEFAWYGWIAAIILEVLVVVAVVVLETALFGRMPTYLSTAVVLGIFEAALVVIAYESIRQVSTRGSVAFAVASGLVAGAAYVAIVQGMCLVLHALRRWRSGRHTYEALAEVLLDACHGIEHRPEAWTDRRFKVETADQLEDAALLVERELPHRMRAADAITDMWYQTATSEIAAAFRLRKQQVFLPTASCRDELLDFLATQLKCVLDGDLGSLERSAPSQKPPHWLRDVVVFAGRIAFGAAPLVAFVAIIQFVKVPATLVTIMVTAGVIWIVLSIATLDPRYREKVEVFGSLSSLFRHP